MLVNPLHQNLFVHRLIIPAEKIVVEIQICIINMPDMDQRFDCKKIIHIKCVLREL